ncbi:diacylglycerol kinase family protein [Flavobacterium sp.]|uniref:diacylglycerol/lipid kinase family protein n=1 Tax=Flavobacterium sp. TaxID=239 RepID=UPI002601E9AC|nr:diacylglycerol kinase family protein [Flavobacterium sp.]
MKYIHFIINPISGDGKHNLSRTVLEKYFSEKEYKIAVDYSNHKHHAIMLTNNAVTKSPDYIVACGGDGTINEVASCLINTQIKLGIIPIGSGNGLASNLKIPKLLEEATQVIKNGKTQSIDIGKVNQQYFFSNMGIGIDALIIKKYDSYKKRTLTAYIKASLQASLKYKPIKAILSFNSQIINSNAFMLFISNSNEMGYGMSLTPNASLIDGKLNLVLIPKISLINQIKLGLHIISKKSEAYKMAQHSLIENIAIELPEKIFVDIQVDGEYHNLKTNKVNVSVIKNGLEIVS